VFLFGMAFYVLRRWREREEQARVMSRIDPLTGLYNRRSILIHLEWEQDRSVQQNLPMAVVMVDLDHFKQINDTWGHEAGDYVLIATAEVLQKAVRQNDRVGRYGGEEFLMVLPGADTEGARRLADRCRQQLEALEVMLSDGRRLRVSCSMGLFCNEKEMALTPDAMLRRADKALYAAKEGGRNQVVVDV
jgi:diguanylate cyclase (GGDEF)-like protein